LFRSQRRARKRCGFDLFAIIPDRAVVQLLAMAVAINPVAMPGPTWSILGRLRHISCSYRARKAADLRSTC